MTAIETLERAISKLETLRDEATEGPWVLRYDGDEPYEVEGDEDIPEEISVGGGRWRTNPGAYGTADMVIELDCYGSDMDEYQERSANAHLVGALSRSVEPMLEILRIAHRLEEMQWVPHESQREAALALARAILGEENADE